ncbi:MAG: hypothetical protein V1797_09185 [Pseudomonadota bacterium]
MPARRLACLAVILALACSAALAAAESRYAVPSGWQVHRGQDGLVVFTPQGWRVDQAGGGAFLALLPGSGGGAEALAMAQPMTIPGRGETVLQNIGQVLPQIFPAVRGVQSRQLSAQPEVAEAQIDYQVDGRPYKAMAMVYKQGDQAMFYAAAATKDAWPRQRGQAMAVLKHFLYAAQPGPAGPGGSGGPGPANLPAMVAFNDPNERAFSCLVPRGWRVKGGLKRLHAVDVRPEVVAESPDGGIMVRLGDADIPPMALANQALAMSGFPEGSQYSPGYGLQQLVLRYLPGIQFATAYYLPRKVGPISQVQARPLPEVARRAQSAHRIGGLSIVVDTGEATFAAQTGQGPRNGYAFVQTYRVEMPGYQGMGTWHVEVLYGYLARPDQEAQAAAVLNAMVQSFQIDSGWLTRQAQTAGQVSNIVTQTNQQITSIIRETFNYRQQVQDRAHEKFDRGAIRGTVLVEDPNTGQKFEVPGGSNYYWRGPDNQVVGTQTDTRPNSPNHWLERMTVLD